MVTPALGGAPVLPSPDIETSDPLSPVVPQATPRNDGHARRSEQRVVNPVAGGRPTGGPDSDGVPPGTPSAAPGDGGTALAALAALATDVPVVVSDPRQADDPLVWVNAAFTRTTGYAAEEAVGRNCRFLQDEGTDPVELERLRAGMAAREPVTVVLRNVRRDGTPFWNEVSVSPVLDERGDLVHRVGVQVDVTARVEAERAAAAARARLSLLADVAEAVAELDVRRSLARLTGVLERLVPWSAVLLVQDGLRLGAVAGVDELPSVPPFSLLGAREGLDPLVDQALGRQEGPRRTLLAGAGAPPADPAEPGAGPSASGWLAGLLDGLLVEPADDAARGGGPRPVLSVPVPGRDGVLGLLVVADAPAGGGEGLDDDDVDLVVEVARRLGLSLASARLHEQQHLLAEALQRSMLPEQPHVPDLDVWSYYVPSADHAQVGGDWFDVMTPGPDAVGLVVGDVVGHDIEAAAAMGQLRSVVRAYAHEQEEPGTVLMRVDQLVAGMRIRRSASLLYARLEDLGDGTWEVSWSRAGHLPPVLVQAGRARALSGGEGVLVGVGDRPRSTAVVEAGPGDVLVLCTDGLVERRSRSLRDGVAALVEACEGAWGTDAAGTGEHLLEVLGDVPEDDLAVVVVRVPGPAPTRPGPRRRRWQLPGDPGSVARARRKASRLGRLWGLPSTAQAELVVSELVGNAVLHGWGPVGLRLQHDERGLLVEVDDANPAPPGVVAERREGPGGFGLHVVERLSDWGWRHSGTGKTVWARLPDQPSTAGGGRG
ncbi:hypothetical protein GCM10009756_01620 [Pseudokineococcus marinus]